MSDENKTFTQDELNSLLAEERRKGERKLEQRTAEFQEAIKTVSPDSDVSRYLVADAAKDKVEEMERQSLRKLFGNTSDAAAANKLAMTDNVKYKQLRKRAQELSVLPPEPKREVMADTSGFHKRDSSYNDAVNKVLNRNR